MSKSSDRVEKWGDVLAELSQTKWERLFQENQKYLECYEHLETKAVNFHPEQLKSELSSSLSSTKPVSITVISHTIELARKSDFKEFILKAFKSKLFFFKPLILLIAAFCKCLGILFLSGIGFCFLLLPGLTWSLICLLLPEYLGIPRLETIKWLVLIILFLIAVFGFGLLCLYVLELITGNTKPFFSWLEDIVELTDEILITDRRQIKLNELRLLFFELKKLKLKPSFSIIRNQNTVDFKLQVKSNSEFIDSLK